MKIIKGNGISFIPASHEDPKDPGALKKVLVKRGDLMQGEIMMINWALLPIGKSFAKHYHEDMEEVFIVFQGKTEISVENETDILEVGDTVIIPVNHTHTMKTIGNTDVLYFAMGISKNKGGKTVNV